MNLKEDYRMKCVVLVVAVFGLLQIVNAEAENKFDELKELKSMLKTLQDKVHHLENENKKISYLQERIMALDKTLHQISKSQATLEETTHQALRKASSHTSSTPVSFTAFASASREYKNANMRIRFDRTVQSYGGGYSTSSSAFTCPYTGLYLFSVSARVEVGKEIRLVIRLNGSRLVYIYSIDDIEQNSNSVVVECHTGDQVDVVTANGHKKNELWGSGEAYSTFSGTMILMYTNQPGI